MGPTLSDVNKIGLQPLLKGDKTFDQAWESTQKPLKTFMLKETRSGELNLFLKASNKPAPKERLDVPLTTLIPAFVLSEIKTAFIIGFVIFIPFLIIDMVVSSTLMSMASLDWRVVRGLYFAAISGYRSANSLHRMHSCSNNCGASAWPPKR